MMVEEYLRFLGYSIKDVTIIVSTYHPLSTFKEKIYFYRNLNLDFIILNDARVLMQSTKLSYARYMYLNSNGINIDESNYKKIFISDKRFSERYHITKEEILKMYGTNIYIEVGEELSVKDLLYGLMLRSGNDAAITLAINTFGSEEEFVSQMNKKAIEIGMKNTNFENVHGLDDETKNYSTAGDMAILARYAYKNKMYRKIISTKKYSCKSSLKSYIWYNRVSILNSYEYSLGGKNGYTPSAGKTLVSYAKKDGMILIIVSLNDRDIYNNHEYLFEDYFSKYKMYKIIDKNNFTYNKKLIGKDIYLKKSFSYPLTEEEIGNVSTLLNIKSEDNNNICGNISIKLNNEEIGKINVYVNEKNKKKDVSIVQKFISLFRN